MSVAGTLTLLFASAYQVTAGNSARRPLTGARQTLVKMEVTAQTRSLDSHVSVLQAGQDLDVRPTSMSASTTHVETMVSAQKT